MKSIAVLLSSSLLAGCSAFPFLQSAGERESGYTYVPIDPFPVATKAGTSCAEHGRTFDDGKTTVLSALPDNAVRMLVERFDRSGAITYGPSKLGSRGETYRVTVDYINADTINLPLWISKSIRLKNGEYQWIPVLAPTDLPQYEQGTEMYDVKSSPPARGEGLYTEFNVPVYVGIGLRVAANVEVVGAKANISGIGVIGAEAEAERVKGSLIVQTLGVNGKSISAALPIQSELNRTTAQNAIVAVGSIKALLYAEDTLVVPRVVGIYLPFPGGKSLVNSIISTVSKDRVVWYRPCGSGTSEANAT